MVASDAWTQMLTDNYFRGTYVPAGEAKAAMDEIYQRYLDSADRPRPRQAAAIASTGETHVEEAGHRVGTGHPWPFRADRLGNVASPLLGPLLARLVVRARSGWRGQVRSSACSSWSRHSAPRATSPPNGRTGSVCAASSASVVTICLILVALPWLGTVVSGHALHAAVPARRRAPAAGSVRGRRPS